MFLPNAINQEMRVTHLRIEVFHGKVAAKRTFPLFCVRGVHERNDCSTPIKKAVIEKKSPFVIWAKKNLQDHLTILKSRPLEMAKLPLKVGKTSYQSPT